MVWDLNNQIYNLKGRTSNKIKSDFRIYSINNLLSLSHMSHIQPALNCSLCFQPIDFPHLLSTLDSLFSHFVCSHTSHAWFPHISFFKTSETLTSHFSLTSFFSSLLHSLLLSLLLLLHPSNWVLAKTLTRRGFGQTTGPFRSEIETELPSSTQGSNSAPNASLSLSIWVFFNFFFFLCFLCIDPKYMFTCVIWLVL